MRECEWISVELGRNDDGTVQIRLPGKLREKCVVYDSGPVGRNLLLAFRLLKGELDVFEDEISEKSLEMCDKSADGLKRGEASDPIIIPEDSQKRMEAERRAGRKIVQIAGDADGRFYALAADGTLWRRALREPLGWIRFPGLPTEEDES